MDLREPDVKPVGEPDAANPHVRFDERGVETEQGEVREAPTTERVGQQLGWYCQLNESGAFMAATTGIPEGPRLQSVAVSHEKFPLS